MFSYTVFRRFLPCSWNEHNSLGLSCFEVEKAMCAYRDLLVWICILFHSMFFQKITFKWEVCHMWQTFINFYFVSKWVSFRETFNFIVSEALIEELCVRCVYKRRLQNWSKEVLNLSWMVFYSTLANVHFLLKHIKITDSRNRFCRSRFFCFSMIILLTLVRREMTRLW